MKKTNVLFLLILIGFSANAQIMESTQKSYSSRILPQTESRDFSRAAASIDTIWSDDFSDTTMWTYGTGSSEWDIDTILTSNLISQGFDSYLNSTSKGNFALIDSDGAGSTATQEATIEYTGSINCSSYPSVRLIFQTYLRQYQESRYVLVSNDGGNVWDSIQVLTQFGTSTNSPNGYLEIVDITPIAGGESNVKIKFLYQGANDWFWSIDDVKIVSAPNNDLKFIQEYYNTVTDLTYSAYYKMMPIRQANAAEIKLGATFENDGVAAQSNTQVFADIKYNGSTVYSDTTDTITAQPGASYDMNFPNNYFPNNGLGKYEITFEVKSDSVDDVPQNNVKTNYFEVSSYQYRWDNDTVTTDNWFDVNTTWEMLLKYEIYETDTVVAVSTFFPFSQSSGRGVAIGDSISYYIYRSSDLQVPVAKNEFYYIQAADVNSWVTLPIPNAQLTPGTYFVGFKVYNNTSSVGSNSVLNGQTPPVSVLVRRNTTSATDPWEYTTGFTPFIRMYTKSADACNNANIVITHDIHDTSTYGAIDIQVTGGGAPPYTYSWTGPNGFTANTKDLTNLSDRGTYYLTVTDVFGCEGKDTCEVAGVVSVNDIVSEESFKMYPNPNNGTFNIEIASSSSEDVRLSIYSILGQEVHRDRLMIKGNVIKQYNLNHLEQGIYIVKVSDANGMVKTIRWVKK
ncbi:T9SS type A sorting domain-containing protein [bacterium SCSIO 12643]|nr:T9SS type A sorting domain-containing protein [bacterium SCSIO 12643]